MSVPEGETKSVTDFAVFVFTAIFSLWAYLWMLIVYVMWTPDRVTVLEAVLTLVYLPIMVFGAYKINTYGISNQAEVSGSGGQDAEDGCGAYTLMWSRDTSLYSVAGLAFGCCTSSVLCSTRQRYLHAL